MQDSKVATAVTTRALQQKNAAKQQKQTQVQKNVAPTGATGHLLHLQRQYGNRFVQRVVTLSHQGEDEAKEGSAVEQSIQKLPHTVQRNRSQVQTKLTLGQLGAHYRQESGSRVWAVAQHEQQVAQLQAKPESISVLQTENQPFLHERTLLSDRLFKVSRMPDVIRQVSERTASRLVELRTFLQDDNEKNAIALMSKLNEDEVAKVLNSREFKELAIDSFNNKEMYSGIRAMSGNLYQSLQWMFDEGTDWEKVRNVIPRASKGKEQVRADNWMKEQFVKICNDKEMIEAVDLLGSTPVQQVDWLAEEGVNAKSIYRIAIAPLSIPGDAITLYDALLNLPRSYRDDIAYYFVSNLGDKHIEMLAKNADGRRLLTLLLAEIADGWTSGDEEKQRDRLMGLIVPSGPNLEQIKKERETKAKTQQTHAIEATQLIDIHSNLINLREEALAKDLLRRLPRDHMLVDQVLNTVSSKNRDDISLALFQAATDEQIKAIALDANGRTVLLRMIQDLYQGDMSAKERAEMQRAMKLISHVDQDKGASVELEVITYLYGGSLDVLGVALAGGSKGHTAISIGDRVYSFELGWSCGRTKDEYLAANREKRDGIGQVLQISEKDARKIQAGLDASCGKGAYIFSGDICTDSSARVLQTVLSNLKAGWNPQRFVGYLETTGVVKAHRFYPKQGR